MVAAGGHGQGGFPLLQAEEEGSGSVLRRGVGAL